MTSIKQYLTVDHGKCDDLLASCDSFIEKGQWDEAQKSAQRFFDAMDFHFGVEEDILFPELEERTGMTHGPTTIMRMEHGQMRELMDQMKEAVAEKSKDQFFGAGETLHILIQQHNMKEENILYPMCDNALGADAESIVSRMQANKQ